MGGRSPNAADLKSIAGSLQPLPLAAGIAVQKGGALTPQSTLYGPLFSEACQLLHRRCQDQGQRYAPQRMAPASSAQPSPRRRANLTHLRREAGAKAT